MKSIRIKLIVFSCTLFILALLAVGALSIFNFNSTLRTVIETSLSEIAGESASLTESRVEIFKKSLETIAHREDMQTMDWETQRSIIQNQLPNTEFIEMAVVTPDGIAHYPDGSTKDLSSRDYIQKALKGESNVSDLLISSVTNELVLMYAAPITKDGEVLGALIGRRPGQALSEIIKDNGIGEKGYAFVTNREGVLAAHPDTQRVYDQVNVLEAKDNKTFASLAAFLETALEKETGVGQFSLEGQDLYAAYSPIKGTDWMMFVVADEKEVRAPVTSLQKQIMISVVIISLITAGAALLVSHSIAKPIINVVKRAEQIADLNIKDDIDKKDLLRKDEVGSLTQAFQQITANLREIIREINKSAEEVVASSEQLTAIAQQSASSATEVSKTVEEIAEGASEQAIRTEEGAQRATLLGEMIDEEFVHSKNVSEASEQIAELVDEGLEEMDNLAKITDESSTATNVIHDIILKTDESAKKIGHASHLIASIADQTNLLALNAAIEAARAGEAGRGFSVVAEEIRKLAEESAASTKTIDNIVEELQNNTGNAVETMERVAVIVGEQADSANANKEKYLAIQQAVHETQQAIERMISAGQAMDGMKNDILGVLQSLSATAQENSAATQEVAATMEEQTNLMESVAKASEELAISAQNLQEMIGKFKTD